MEKQPKIQWSQPYNYTGVESIDTGREHQWRYSPDFHNAVQLTMQLTGSRQDDCVLANEKNNQSYLGGRSPNNYTWHHCYNLHMNEARNYKMQLPARDLHRRCCPHVGAFKQGMEMGFYNTAANHEKSEEFIEKVQLRTVQYQESSIIKEIKLLEHIMQRLLPLCLIEFYLTYAPGVPDKTIFYKSNQGIYNISWFDEIINGSNSILQILHYELHWRNTWRDSLLFSQKWNIPFAEDNCGNIYFLSIEENSKLPDVPVYFYDHEEDCALQIADNFKSFQNGWFHFIKE